MKTFPKIDEFGNKHWYNRDGELHRVDGPAYESIVGSKSWYQNGLLHRLDGPAVEYDDGDKAWYQNGKRHRVDGPAIEFNSVKCKYWFYQGNHIDCSSQREFERIIKLKAFW